MITRNISSKKEGKSSINSDLLNGHDLVVFCHLRWEFVTQRPQHVINRIGKGRKVLFVEEPIDFNDEDEGTVHIIKPSKNITVLQPRIKKDRWTYALKSIVEKQIEKMNLIDPILWFYSAEFLPNISIKHSLVVYDCMDELSAFKGASPLLITQEEKLIKTADVVFTGGKSLYESKKRFSDNVHCFPSSVDRRHFEKSLSEETPIASDIASLPKPIVGYYGVIDERIDMDLLKNAANALPNVTFVMVGPVVKITEQDLAKNKNIHYLGSKDYKDLPHYLKNFDIAMMPFAMNESTKFISPTKTLEYMAALKPIVSTPIYDVVRDYSKDVAIASTADEFVLAIKRYLSETSQQKAEREAGERKIIQKTSWNITAKKMKKLMAEALHLIKASKSTSYPPKIGRYIYE